MNQFDPLPVVDLSGFSHGANDRRWIAFAVEPDDYEELESKVWGWFSERGFVRPSKN